MMDNKNLTCCFTGHRPNKLPWGYDETKVNCLAFKEVLKIEIEKIILDGYKVFLSGMALGIDQIACDCVFELKKKYNDIKLIACVPCKNQDIKWNKNAKEKYKNILQKCDRIITLSENYQSDCMQKRNEFMVKNSSAMIAIWNGKPSGTKNTIELGKEKDCKIIIINPEDFI